MPIRTPICLVLAACLAGPGTGLAATPLLLCYEDVPQRPWTMPDGTGLNLDLLRRVEKQLGERFVFVAKPWKRCLSELRSGAVDALVGAGDAPQRRSYAVVPTLPDDSADPARALFDDAIYVYLRVGGRASWDGKRLATGGGAVAVQTGYLVGETLRERGYVTKEPAKSTEQTLRLVADGLVDVGVLQGSEASRLVRVDPRIHGRVVKAPVPFSILHLHLMAGRAAYRREPQRFDAIWRSIGAVRQSRDYKQLQARELAAAAAR